MDDDRLRRAEQNEQVFQEHNERRALIEAGGSASGLIPLICECDDPGCFRPLLIALDEYAAAVEPYNHFVVVPGHENLEVEAVVESFPSYLVVEKPDLTRRGREQ